MFDSSEKCNCKKHCNTGGGSGALYCLGVIGAAVYYLQQATSFSLVLLGLVKAVFWPAFVLHKVLGLLGM
jgi:hypothetical protein